MDEVEDYVEDCSIPEIQTHRWYIVAIIGTPLSIISLITNVLIARVLLKRKHSHFYFLGVLAISDSFLSFCYFPVVANEIMRFSIGLWWVKLWWYYIATLLGLCHVSMTFSCFMIILGSIERYLITVKSQYLNCFRQSRIRFSIIMLCIAFLLRGTSIFEVQIVKKGNCTDMMEYEPDLTPMAQSWFYGSIFKFYIRTIMTVFIPFGLLSYLNYKIVTILRKQQRSASMFRFGSSEHKVKARSATRLLVLIVFSYLLANTLNVLVTSWEFVDFKSINDHYTIYEVMTDLVSVFYVFTCATRLLVYISCNEEIRFALYDFVCGSRKKKASTAHDYKPIQKLHYDGSIRQKSMTLGTDFDKIALAVVLSQRARDLQQNFLLVPPNSVPLDTEQSTHQNGSVKSLVVEDEEDKEAENHSFIISNPLANVSAPPTPSSDRKNPTTVASASSSSYNLMVKVVPYS